MTLGLSALLLICAAFVAGLVIGEDSLPGSEGDVPLSWGRDDWHSNHT